MSVDAPRIKVVLPTPKHYQVRQANVLFIDCTGRHVPADIEQLPRRENANVEELNITATGPLEKYNCMATLTVSIEIVNNRRPSAPSSFASRKFDIRIVKEITFTPYKNDAL
jgi:hypothetical protein